MVRASKAGTPPESATNSQADCPVEATEKPACPACGGALMEIRAKLQCVRCRLICETCCEGGRG